MKPPKVSKHREVKIYETRWDIDRSRGLTGIGNFLKTFTDAVMDNIPEEYRDVASVTLFPDSYNEETLITFNWIEPESDEEYNARLAKLSSEKKKANVVKELRDRREYERLKKKFGDA